MRGDYTLEPLGYGIHHRGIQLVDIVEDTQANCLDKDRSQETFFINLRPGSCNQLMELWEVQ